MLGRRLLVIAGLLGLGAGCAGQASKPSESAPNISERVPDVLTVPVVAAAASAPGSREGGVLKSSEPESSELERNRPSSEALVGVKGAWSEQETRVLRAVEEGRPLVTRIVVPLCSSKQIDCGASWAGNPKGLATNVYWGAQYGAKRFFERADSGWERVLVGGSDDDAVLERAIFRKRVSAEPWGKSGTLEQLVVLDAIDGDRIEVAVERLWRLAQGHDEAGSRLRFVDDGRERNEEVLIIGYAGHNRLMDGVRLSPPSSPSEGARPRAAFILACFSEKYFGDALASVGAQRLVLSQSYMAPEGYVLRAVVDALGDNVPARALRERAMLAYAKWQRLGKKEASRILSPDLAAP